MSTQNQQKKVHTFTLLTAKTLYTRLDVLPLPFTISTFLYYFSSDILSYNFESIWLILSFIGLVTLHFFLFLLNFWSGAANSLISYWKASSIQTCTHVKVTIEHKQAHTFRTLIVPLKANSVEKSDKTVTTTYSIEFHKKKMIWNGDRKVFLAIPFPVNHPIGVY